MITRDEVLNLLDYNREAGCFTWRSRANGRVPAGSVAGHRTNTGHLSIQLEGRAYKTHRLVWLVEHGKFPEKDIDHVNGDRADNRISNLRDVDRRTNMENQRKAHKGNVSGFLGVSKAAGMEKWISQIQVNKVKIGLGYFDSPEEAHEAYLSAKRRLHPGCTV